jgi:hypothetical protein
MVSEVTGSTTNRGGEDVSTMADIRGEAGRVRTADAVSSELAHPDVVLAHPTVD